MTSPKNLDVRRSKSSLVATFAKAHPPLIWRFDLERNHSFTLGLQGGDPEWELGISSPKGEFHPVARFPVREDAEEAFSAVSAALAKGDGLLQRILLVIGALFVLYVAFTLVAMAYRSFFPSNQESYYSEDDDSSVSAPPSPISHTPAPVAVTPPAPPPPTTGVPLPADQVLKPPAP